VSDNRPRCVVLSLSLSLSVCLSLCCASVLRRAGLVVMPLYLAPLVAGVTDPDERNAMMIELLQELREDGGESVRRSRG